MRYSNLIKNDVVNGQGVCVSFFTQGCPHHCSECFNPETWSFDGGKEFTNDTLNEILNAINDNNIVRNFSILGGEPLCDENIFLTRLVVNEVRNKFPEIKIFIWTGYTIEQLSERITSEPHLQFILENANFLIDGKYEKDKRDLTLKLRGSSNQRIIDLTKGKICF